MRIYIAGSYSDSNVINILNNIHEGIRVSAKILKAGHEPFCPFLDYQFQFFDNTLTVEDYYRYSIAWLEVSDIMVVLPYSDTSRGTQKEIIRAMELDIPVVNYIDEIPFETLINIYTGTTNSL